MKTLFLVFTLTMLIGNAQGSVIKASYFDFKPELTKEFSIQLENGGCIDINVNNSTYTIHYSTVGLGLKDKFAGHVNINIWSGYPGNCPDQSVYSVYNAPTSGTISGSDFNPILCDENGPDFYTLWIKYNRGDGTYCSEYRNIYW